MKRLAMQLGCIVVGLMLMTPALATEYDLAINNGRVMNPETIADKGTCTESVKTETVKCPEVRPEMCTTDYRPVCGSLSDGTLKTYSNGCDACSDHEVASYVDGACK